MQIKRILVTTDFSESSRLTFSVAASFARRFGAELHVAHVLEAVPTSLYFSPTGAQSYSPSADYRLKFRELLDTVAKAPEWGGLAVKPHLLEDRDVAGRLVQFQKHQHIDFTITASRGRSALEHFFLGSTAEKLVRRSATPVLVYRTAPGAAPPPEFAPQRIIVPFDYSENARAVFPLLRFLVRTFQSQVCLVHALEALPDLTVLSWEGIAPIQSDVVLAEAPGKARQELESLIRKDLSDLPKVEAVAELGNAYQVIVKEAVRFKADLILIATHGWTGLKHVVMGSIAEKVIRKAPCSVLALKPEAMA